MSETDESDDSVDNVPSLPHGVDYNNNHHTCDWASEKRCSPFIQLKKCQHPEGCDNYVHHLCTIEWAHVNHLGFIVSKAALVQVHRANNQVPGRTQISLLVFWVKNNKYW